MVYITILDYRSFRRDLYYSPNEEIGFELEPVFLPEDITSASIADYKVFAYTNQYQY